MAINTFFVQVFVVSLAVLAITTDALTLEEKIKQVANSFLSTGSQSLLRQPEREPPAPLVDCATDSQCEGYQICEMGRCQCPHPTEQYFWYTPRQCQIDPGRPCHPDSPIPCWGDHAKCEVDAYSRTGYSCTCQDGLESDGWYCTNGYMRNCARSWSSGADGCNYGAGLGCFQNKCQCEFWPDQKYDQVKKRCVAGRGYACFTLGEHIGYMGCAAGLECVRREGSTDYPLLGFCR